MISSDNDNIRGVSGRRVLGLTGGIGTGKTTAAEHIVSRGFLHIDADSISRELTKKGNPLIKLLGERFGSTIILSDGSLDRKALAQIVFNDPEKKKALDDIMFSRITEIIVDEISSAEGPVLIDAPLLFEAGLERFCNGVILLTCDTETRIERVTARDGVSRDEVIARINSQMPDVEKKLLADYVIDNSGTEEELHASIDRVINRFLSHGSLDRS